MSDHLVLIYLNLLYIPLGMYFYTTSLTKLGRGLNLAGVALNTLAVALHILNHTR